MKIITCPISRNQYIDKELYEYVNNIFTSFSGDIVDDSGIMFAPNTTINRSIPDYNDRDIRKVKKLEKVDYFVLRKFQLNSYPVYFDGTHIVEDDTKEIVYGIYNLSDENIVTIKYILDFYHRGQTVIYIDQNKLNDSLNSGLIIDENNYFSILELLKSRNSDNISLATTMVASSNLKNNWEWIIYLYHSQIDYLHKYDTNKTILNYIESLNISYTNHNIFNNIDCFFEIIENEDIKLKMIQKIKQDFFDYMEADFANIVKTSKVKLVDFKIVEI
jgi:hypothetical protein